MLSVVEASIHITEHLIMNRSFPTFALSSLHLRYQLRQAFAGQESFDAQVGGQATSFTLRSLDEGELKMTVFSFVNIKEFSELNILVFY